MLVSIVAALMLQSTTPVMLPAHCSMNGAKPVPCQVLTQRQGPYYGVGFALPGGNVVYGGKYVNEQVSEVEVITAGDSTVSGSGHCVRRGDMIGCRAIVAGEEYMVIAQLVPGQRI